MEETVDKIGHYCWCRLHELGEPSKMGKPLFKHYNQKSLSWQQGKQIYRREAIIQLKVWIRETLNKYGAVFLYIGKDNAEIAIEEVEDINDPDLLNLFDKHPELPLFIGYD